MAEDLKTPEDLNQLSAFFTKLIVYRSKVLEPTRAKHWGFIGIKPWPEMNIYPSPSPSLYPVSV